MKHIKGPDFPTGGIIMGRAGIRDAYETGRGSRAGCAPRAKIEEMHQRQAAIVVTEASPYQTSGEGDLSTKIAELVREKKIDGISDLRDEIDRRRHAPRDRAQARGNPKVVLNKLYKHTPMQTTFAVNMVALVDGVPRTLSLREVLSAYIAHQREVVVRRAKFELAQKEARAHVLEGLLIALDNLDAVIEVIRQSRDREAAREELVARFSLTQIQASAILDLRLSQLTALESDSIKQEHADVMERIRELRELLGDEAQRAGADQGGAARDLRALRRSAPDRDRAVRGRARHRGPDRRPADGHHHHEVGLHQAGAAGDLPPAAPGWRRHHGDGPQGRRLHRAPLRLLDARLPAVLHQPRQGVPVEGLRAARGCPHHQGPRAGQHPAAA